MLRTLGAVGGLLGASGLLIVASGSASAASDPPPQLEKAFHGTIVSTYPDGRKAELWLKPDGTYISEGRKHDRHNGKWAMRGEKVCFKRMIFTYCTAIPSETEFTTKAVTGETIRVRLEPGRAGLAGGSGKGSGEKAG